MGSTLYLDDFSSSEILAFQSGSGVAAFNETPLLMMNGSTSVEIVRLQFSTLLSFSSNENVSVTEENTSSVVYLRSNRGLREQCIYLKKPDTMISTPEEAKDLHTFLSKHLYLRTIISDSEKHNTIQLI